MRHLLTATLLAIATAAGAEEGGWPDIRAQLYGVRALDPAGGVIALDAPYRTADDARTVVGVALVAPPGLRIGAVTLVLDENPMPVSAILRLVEPLPRFRFETTLRINGPTPVHVIAETADGQLFMAEGFVKTSGQGACAAPPGTDPEAALATLGEMTIGIGAATAADPLGALSGAQMDLTLGLSHPSHSGMQMDQITLLFIPMRHVEDVRIDLDGKPYAEITGSISLSENPEMTLSIPADTRGIDVTMTDTDGTVAHASKRLADY
ncbi:MAG: quinoprotein dehydrogenase-associated SoxYZ-like carrier [Rhodobacteraceae bacterium]|jgi:sulfur-oxidizing protein SoxY|uniref:quinoprotein dehydrogenase-associated SoxYZ-like carrier n=1 Tax=Albidovulum sp. TaxID=1872424 RepID=UPI001D240B0F|nr:quinoprotein dehydrogenase-associated SoxYZ-like carrier [uncultured Defluviimonas sp.]MCB2125988.1 quinoprotein dehydrogenase-associated SoxYZ-like carrier [Paracoccaceae bacterium]MCC0070425.1 quinoprotein dehydrogenase-associated SoxYZ-like carrier [Paracoccaceae bacterium]